MKTGDGFLAPGDRTAMDFTDINITGNNLNS